VEDNRNMYAFYYKTFTRVCLLPYIGGTIFHILRLIYHFPIEQIPSEVDWAIVILGGYGGIGLVVFRNRILFKNMWDKIAYGLLIFHLNGSVLLHAHLLVVGNHDALHIFPYWYSFIAIGYFLAFGMYVIRLIQRLDSNG